MSFRIETDTMGEQKIPSERYWGAQTQRSLNNFSDISKDIFPISFIHAFAIQKMSSAYANKKTGVLAVDIADVIIKVCEEIIAGKHDDNFPLCVWQTGSGTQTNMNLNEVIAGRANEILTGKINTKSPIHPNDHVNKSQSSNDSFPTVMNISSVLALQNNLLPALKDLLESLQIKEKEFSGIVKIGRTHMQDAVPMTLEQEFSAYVAQVNNMIFHIDNTMNLLYPLAQGGSAIGTSINVHKNFVEFFIEKLCDITKLPFVSAKNKFESIATNDGIVAISGALNALATTMMKIANDIRLLSSGPRCGIGEITLPANEPGSSIMPGKINPTQCEAMTMICAQVIGNHTAITIGGSSGHLQLNVFRPMIIFNVLNSINLLSGGIRSFNLRCAKGIVPNRERIEYLLNKSLMLVTALSPKIGYDNASKVAKLAYEKHISIKEATVSLGMLSAEECDELLDPHKMI